MSLLNTVVRRTLLLGAGAGTVMLNIPELYADTAAPVRKPSTALSIYDPPAPEKNLPAPSTPSDSPSDHAHHHHPTPTERVAEKIGVARSFINVHYALLVRRTDEMLDNLHARERTIVQTIAGLAPPRESPEKVLPGLVYTGVTAMGGSLLVRNRNILLRGVTPLVVFVVAMNGFLPETSERVGDLLWEWEGKVSGVREAHTAVRDGVKNAVDAVEGAWVKGRKEIEGVVGSGVRWVEDVVKRG